MAGELLCHDQRERGADLEAVIKSRKRRQYEGLVFGARRKLPRYYNLWRGFAIEPKPGDCSKFLAHLKDNVCEANKELYRWVIAWFAEIMSTRS